MVPLIDLADQHMKHFVTGLSYKTAPVALREKLASHPSRLRCHGCCLKLAANLSEVVLDHLEAIARENVKSREQELTRCREIISERAEDLLARLAPGNHYHPRPQAEPPWALGGTLACPG